MAGRSEPGEEVFDQMASFVEFRVVFALYLAVGLQDSWAGGGRCWWRRRESNPNRHRKQRVCLIIKGIEFKECSE